VHYVQRSGDLLTTLSFLAELGFRVLRHEENEQACPISCNGAFENPWSKTMVGTLTEDKAYALELTYNYGVAQYDSGRHRSLVNFGVVVADPSAISQAAGELGYFTAPLPPVAGLQTGWLDAALAPTVLVIGPDDYYYTLMVAGETELGALTPRFHHVSFRVSSLQHSLLFYTELLGMRQLPDAISENARTVGVATACLLEGRPKGYADSVMSTAVGYSDDELVFVLIDDGYPVTRTEWGGRNAIAVPEPAVRRINAALLQQQSQGYGEDGGRATNAANWSARSRGKIVHPLQILEEKLGRLLILIVADPDGNELCLVSREVFDQSALAADDFTLVRCIP
jgi:catechol 2,3-dioxygenase-like lactoylglutathione lyase family enzyme